MKWLSLNDLAKQYQPAQTVTDQLLGQVFGDCHNSQTGGSSGGGSAQKMKIIIIEDQE